MRVLLFVCAFLALPVACGSVLGLDGINYDVADGAAAALADAAHDGNPGTVGAGDGGSDASTVGVNAARPDGPFTLVQTSGTPQALVVDEARLYWVNAQGGGNGAVQSSLKDGTGSVGTIAANQPSPLDIAVNGANVYWSVNQTPPAGTASQCLAMTAAKDGGAPACAVSAPAASMRMAVTASYIALLSQQPANGGGTNQYVGAIGPSSGGYHSILTQGPAQAIAVTAGSLFVGNKNGLHIDEVALPGLETFGPITCISNCGGTPAVDMMIDESGSVPLWVTQIGGVYSLAVPPPAPQTGTHLAELPEAPQRMARDASYVYVTTTSSVFAVPITLTDAGPTSRAIASGEVHPFGIAVDDAYVYWTDGAGRIRATSVPPPP